MAKIRLLNSSFDVWEQKSLEKQIERAGRICYKSEDKIAAGTAEVFVDRMKANKHYAMLEHGTIYLKNQCEVNTDHYQDFVNFLLLLFVVYCHKGSLQECIHLSKKCSHIHSH